MDKEELARQVFELEKDIVQAEAAKGLLDLYFFNREILEFGNLDRQLKIVPHVHGEWSAWHKRSKKRLKMILVPRGTFKSTFITVGYSLQSLVNNRDERILIASGKQQNASKFLGEIKSHITMNESFKDHYGELYNPGLKWSETEIELAGRSSGVREPSVSVIGVEGNLVSQHYSKIIWDDLVNEQNIITRDSALKVIDWWKRTHSLLDPDGEGIVVGTRWAFFELYQYILDELGDEVDIFIRSCYKEDGSLYFPELLGADKLEEIKRLQGSYIFSTFYLNSPIDEDSAMLKDTDLHYFDDRRDGYCCPTCGKTHKLPNRKEVSCFTMVDPAVSQKETSDFSALPTVFWDTDDNWWVVEDTHGRFSTQELIMRMFEKQNQYHNDGMSLEVIGQAQHLLYSIHQVEGKLGNPYLPLTEIKSRSGQSKESRIKSVLQPRFERGKVYLRSDMQELKDQLLRFPRAKHDDLVDALTDLAEIGFRPDEPKEENHEPVTIEERLRAKMEGVQRRTYEDDVLGEFI